jgi:uncharacterized membrane protein YccF (DUF307 family)
MVKNLPPLARFALSLLFLLATMSLILSGYPEVAVVAFAGVAGYALWQRRRVEAAEPSPQTGHRADRWTAKLHVLDILVIVLWLAAMVVASGVLGAHPEIFTAIAGIGVAIAVARSIKYRRKPGQGTAAARPHPLGTRQGHHGRNRAAKQR